MKRERQRQELEDAWLGDAVLSLFARRQVLAKNGKIDAERFVRMTSNQFLNSIGEPTSVEAEIGRVYSADGLDAAFDWIERFLMPVFRKQEANRDKRVRV